MTSCEGCDVEKIFAATFRDKKVLSGKINWVLMKKIGAVEIISDVPEKIVKNAIKKILR